MSFFNLLRHYLIPHESNNHKSKILHTSTIVVISLILLVYQISLYLAPKTGIKILGYKANISVEEVVRLTNEKREQAGLSDLQFSSVLSQAAERKGNNMLAKNYWAHVSPDGTEPWKFFLDVGYKYRYAGENLARDFSNAPSAVNAWMASSTHRENILSPKYKEIGIAVVEGGLGGVDTTIIVQFFGTKLSGAGSVPVAKAKTNQSITGVKTPIPTIKPVTLENKEEVNETPIPSFQPSYLEASNQKNKSISNQKQNILVSPFATTRSISLIVIVVLLLTLIIDAIFVSKKRIARIGGRTLAHLSFFGMILAIIIILRAGQIL